MSEAYTFQADMTGLVTKGPDDLLPARPALWIFNPQEELQCVLSNDNPGACPYWDDKHTENVNGLSKFGFGAAGDHDSSQWIVPKAMVGFPDLDGEMRLYRINKLTEGDSESGKTKTAECESVAQEELLALKLRPQTHTNKAPDYVLGAILSFSRWDVGVVESAALNTIKWTDYPTTWKGVMDIAALWGLEIVCRVKMTGNRITERTVNLLQSRGEFTGKFFDYSKDVSSMKRVGGSEELYTSLIGIGKSKSDGTFVNFAAEAWTDPPNPCEKPAGQDWIGDDAALELYGLPYGNGRLHREGEFRDPDETSPTQLLANTYKALQVCKQPLYTYEIDAVSLERMGEQQPGMGTYRHERVRLGDTVASRDFTLQPPLLVRARVTEVTRCGTDPTQDRIVLGDQRTVIASIMADMRDLQKRVYNSEGQWSGWTG